MGNLESVSADTLRDHLDRVDDVAATKRLMVAITYKEVDGLSQNEAAAMFGFSSGWASHWFRRLERLATEPSEAVLSDEDRPGRPPKLSDPQRERFAAALRAPPREQGLDADAWTVRLARQYLAETFAVEYSDRHVRRLLRQAGLTWRATPPGSDRERGEGGTAANRPSWVVAHRS